jgi:Fic family protein
MAYEAKKQAPPVVALNSSDSRQRLNVQRTNFEEKHFTVQEIAEIWNVSKDTVRRMFQNEPGVLVLGGHSSRRKRRYTTLRIPQSILERVHRQYSLYC